MEWSGELTKFTATRKKSYAILSQTGQDTAQKTYDI
jgi:hypothetical protein